MNAITTNIHLKRYKIREKDLCTFCDMEKETLIHLFFKCKHVKGIWEWIAKSMETNIQYQHVMFSNVNSDPRCVKNCVILIAKHYVYRARCLNERLSIVACQNYIIKYHDIEKVIAQSKGKLS